MGSVGSLLSPLFCREDGAIFSLFGPADDLFHPGFCRSRSAKRNQKQATTSENSGLKVQKLSSRGASFLQS